MFADFFSAFAITPAVVFLLILVPVLAVLIIYSRGIKRKLAEKEGFLRLLSENSRDIIFRIRTKPSLAFEYLSPATKKILDYAPEEFYQEFDLMGRIISPEYAEVWHRLRFAPERVGNNFAVKLYAGDNREVWLEIQQTGVFDETGQLLALEGIARDITERKQRDSQLWFLTLHDSLTGLSNRLYFEDRLQNLQREGFSSIGIVVCDIEGLKLINDTLGHNQGDNVLKATTAILKECFRGIDTLARIGGDEFAAILTGCSLEELQRKCERLEQMATKHNIETPETYISLSLGYSYRSGAGKGLFELYREAEDMMYKNKLKQANVARIAIVNALVKSIKDKDYKTQGHSLSLVDIIEKTALLLNLPPHSIEVLRKLALFHDIGKIGVPDNILLKPGPLNEVEMAEMKKHCEIGYRIALSTPDLVMIADLILKHHERWDGKGYPLGLKKREIPVECRLLAVADAFDAMTSDRPYRPAMSREIALREIMSCSGTQFDPDVVEAFMQVLQEDSISFPAAKELSYRNKLM